MTIKRFGVQLAGSGLVILLGALGVAQAQRDSQKTEPAEWEVESPPAMGPPVPIAASSDESPADIGRSYPDQRSTTAEADQTAYSFAGQRAESGAAPANVRQVTHEETFALPTDTYEVDEDSAGAGPTGFALPSWSADGDAPTYQGSEPSPDQTTAPNGFGGQTAPTVDTTGYGYSPPTDAGQPYVNEESQADQEDSAASAPGGFSAPAMIGGAAAIGAVAIDTIGSNSSRAGVSDEPDPTNYADASNYA
jgi:hypothetical protein